jgi:cytochrome d ubiquinol oxidase subunit II
MTKIQTKKYGKNIHFGSLIPSLLYGVAIGNLIQGLPLNANMDYEGGLIGLLRPFPLIAGVFGLILIINHGALYATLKTENELNLRSRKISRILSISTLFLFVVTTISYSLLSTTRDANVWVYLFSVCFCFIKQRFS